MRNKHNILSVTSLNILIFFLCYLLMICFLSYRQMILLMNYDKNKEFENYSFKTVNKKHYIYLLNLKFTL